MINIMRRFNNLERDRTQNRIPLLLIALVKPHPGAKPLTVGCPGLASDRSKRENQPAAMPKDSQDG
jgi:hypothetical protein